jgi:hypothetical protein
VFLFEQNAATLFAMIGSPPTVSPWASVAERPIALPPAQIKWRSGMTRIPDPIYETADELIASIIAREAEAATLPPGEPRQSILKEVVQLRMYADVKRWTESPRLKPEL